MPDTTGYPESNLDAPQRMRREPTTGAPRWVKVFGLVVAALVLIVVVMILTGNGDGGHGPGRHAGELGSSASSGVRGALPQ